MGYEARIEADSISPIGIRLTTFVVTFPRCVLAEFNTHRAFCLAGDTVLEFDLPGSANKGKKRTHKMRLDYFTDRWFNGADRESKGRGGRFSIRDRMKRMRIRQMDESTGGIRHSTVVDCILSGEKEVFVLSAQGFSVAASADHLFMTEDGYLPLRNLIPGVHKVGVQAWGKPNSEKTDANRHKKINGIWRNKWQDEIRKRRVDRGDVCDICGGMESLQIHHKEPVYLRPDLAFEENNVLLVCEMCHTEQHRKQGWQGGNRLYVKFVSIDSVVFRGVEMTYDLEIAGSYPNFLANGIVVHNSRNSASSRAIPVEKMIRKVLDDPYIPEEFGKNQKGMQSYENLDAINQSQAREIWLTAADQAVRRAEELKNLEVHKQFANRLLEPFLWHTCVVTATEWANFFHLRVHKMASPPMQRIASMMAELYFEQEPIPVEYVDWHLPFIQPDEKPKEDIYGLLIHDVCKISAARCARVSYLTHDGKRDTDKDLELYERLIGQVPRHSSALEHTAFAGTKDMFVGNFRGWVQLRKMIPDENLTRYTKEDLEAYKNG